MKKLWILIAVLLSVMPTLAQDQGFESYTYQANSLCEFRITVQADSTITYHLSYYDTVQSEGVLNAGDDINLYLPLTDQWYILIVEREAGDKDAYSVDTGLACDGRIENDDPPAPSPELMSIWEQAQERVMSWRQSIFGEP